MSYTVSLAPNQTVVVFVTFGATTRRGVERFREHRLYAVNSDMDKPTGKHWLKKGHKIADLRITIIEKVRPQGDDLLLEARESMWINVYDATSIGDNKKS